MIELLDKHFGILVNYLENIGQLENTLLFSVIMVKCWVIMDLYTKVVVFLKV